MDSLRGNERALRITADEINCLIHAYLLDSGFTHSAFAVKMEGQLERSPYASRHIRRGELVELLTKSLLYIEVESHWKGDSLANNCKSSFSLLEPHTCSTVENTVNKHSDQPNQVKTTSEDIQMNPPKLNGSSIDTPPKRKESPTAQPADGPAEKRAKHDLGDVEEDIRMYTLNEIFPGRRPKRRMQGPGDDVTDPRTVLVLHGHKAEVFVCGFNPVNHEILATGSKDAIVNLWTLPKPPESPTDFAKPVSPVSIDYFSKAEQADLTSLDWNSEGSLVAIGSYDATLRIYCCLDVDWLDNETFATCGADKAIYLMSVNETQPLKMLAPRGHTDEINQIKINPAGTRLASCSDDRTARIWNVDNLSSKESIPGLVASDAVVVLSGHKHSVSTIGWCPDPTLGQHPLIATPNGRWLATGSGDGWLYIYNVLVSSSPNPCSSRNSSIRKTHEKTWSWFADHDQPGVFEIDWQVVDGINRIALALECQSVAVIDVSKIPALLDEGSDVKAMPVD
ncbi:hypothetical protein H0H87_006474 [Tephrocybe sp. NHM501043]|nr:hypothetical protein H0H87_006474 [Tephrocybe sp. NHM501043]